MAGAGLGQIFDKWPDAGFAGAEIRYNPSVVMCCSCAISDDNDGNVQMTLSLLVIAGDCWVFLSHPVCFKLQCFALQLCESVFRPLNVLAFL